MNATQTEFEAAVARGLESLRHVSAGLAGSCPDCQRAYGMDPRRFYAATQDGTVDDEGGFSWRPCECCGSSFGGDRYAAHAWTEGEELVHLDVCVDCLCYLANGDIPQTWQQHPAH